MSYFYKSQDGYLCLKKPLKDISGYIEITEQEFEEHNLQIFKVNEIQRQINQYKKLLADTDYKAIKYAEGLISEENYAPIKELRQSYRDAINELEEGVNKK